MAWQLARSSERMGRRGVCTACPAGSVLWVVMQRVLVDTVAVRINGGRESPLFRQII